MEIRNTQKPYLMGKLLDGVFLFVLELTVDMDLCIDEQHMKSP